MSKSRSPRSNPPEPGPRAQTTPDAMAKAFKSCQDAKKIIGRRKVKESTLRGGTE